MRLSIIRLAIESDFDSIKKIANQNREFIGFVMKVALKEALSKKSLYVYEKESVVIGFVHYHPRKDGWNTIHEIAVAKDFQRQGIGENLFDIVPFPIRLKTTIDNKNAIKFYEKKLMKLVNIENGKKRKLCVFEKI